jgi:site-specific recombinase XerD
VDEAIEMYLQAFYQKFHNREGRRHRKRSLQMFLQYPTKRGHSLEIKDLTRSDGQGFLDSLTNHFDGTPLTTNQKKKYRNALRSFSRFLHQMGIMEENMFLVVMIDD